MKDDVNKRLCELLGICWHEQVDVSTLECKHCGKSMLFPWEQNPDFSNPIEVLKVMKSRSDWFDFVSTIGGYEAYGGKPIEDQSTLDVKFDDEPINGSEWILVDLLLTPGALRDKAIEWMEERHERL